jgi:hypothetical protein
VTFIDENEKRSLRALARVVLSIPVWVPLLICVLQVGAVTTGRLAWLGSAVGFGVLFVAVLRWIGGTVVRGLAIWLLSFGMIFSGCVVVIGLLSIALVLAGEGEMSGPFSVGLLFIGSAGGYLCEIGIKFLEESPSVLRFSVTRMVLRNRF